SAVAGVGETVGCWAITLAVIIRRKAKAKNEVAALPSRIFCSVFIGGNLWLITFPAYCLIISPIKDAVASAVFLRAQANTSPIRPAIRPQTRLRARSSNSE